MRHRNSAIGILQLEIENLEAQLAHLRTKLAEAVTAEIEANSCHTDAIPGLPDATKQSGTKQGGSWGWPLDADDYTRYGRQMIMPEIGLEGQLRLKGAAVLIVGVGGLGCPAATYLAGAGVGTLGLVDGDRVETSNLHRQILHASDRVGSLKVTSAIESLKQLNPKVNYRAHTSHLEPVTALSIIDDYDLVLDCTDHPTSRYLISDAVVIAGKPLVSASALRTEGQLLVLNNPPTAYGDRAGGFCYRCIFPKPPPIENVVSCGEGGILGPVVGVMGVLMAIEAIKTIAAGQCLRSSLKADSFVDLNGNATTTNSSSATISTTPTPSLLVYSAYSFPPFRSMRLRGQRSNCPSCSNSASITRESLTSGSMDYLSFCGIASHPNLLPVDERMSAKEFKEKIIDRGVVHTLVDVREKTQYDICHLEDSLNIPLSDLFSYNRGNETVDGALTLERLINGDQERQAGPICFICRFGNDSQVAVKKLRASPGFESTGRIVRDIVGGLAAWRKDVDPGFPEY
ncbi:Urmylation protein [Pseudocyphellaria aurata]|nr:Urmylation protein [Pseudocyphellaria aurata]